MHKITNQARHGWEKIPPAMGFGKPPQGHNGPGNQHIYLSFNVPFSSNLPGPEPEEVIYSSRGAFERWIQPDASTESRPNHELPVHKKNVENLRALCKQMSDASGGALQAAVTSSKPKPVPGFQRGSLTALITNVCMSGSTDLVHKMRAKTLNETPITLRSATIEVSPHLIMNPNGTGIREDVLKHMDDISNHTKADLFLLQPKHIDADSASLHGGIDGSSEGKLRIVIYGDMECCEHAKTRLLIMIDQILRRQVDTIKLELSLHNLICGRHRRNIKIIESTTSTAIYFPPLFPNVFGYIPYGAYPRSRDEIIITGDSQDNILQAKKKLHELVVSTKTFMKDVVITTSKVDYILLERLEKIKKIIEQNGSYVLLPPLGNHSGMLRVQATDILNVERTVREIMSLAGQFYTASWMTNQDASERQPTPADIRAMLTDICINSEAEISLANHVFQMNGSDDSVKAAMHIINSLPFVKRGSSNICVKIELANEHKEFVSGKKNGKINKIMSQSNVQIVFDGWNEYNFYIDVRSVHYEATKSGLDLVELEMPASISFHVPDQYHKRIIGIGGQHIQRIMKKYSVFVKFSNAMDRGGIGKEDEDVKVDNVICRTPARNADNLEQVKQEIMDMVEKVDAEFVMENVIVDRLYHRELITRMPEIEELEKKWNCKITFPGTEQASDLILVSGPEYQVPQAVDQFLGMVPESHEIAFPSTDELHAFLHSPEFVNDVRQKLRDQYVVDVTVRPLKEGSPVPRNDESDDGDITNEVLLLTYTRNNAGGVRDAIEFLTLRLVGHGLDASTVKGGIARPKSDSFEDSMPFFDSKLLQRAEPPVSADSPTRPNFGEEGSDHRSFLDKLRKPGSIPSFSSFLERRKNGGNSPGSLFKHASSNASKASLVSMESRESGHRGFWNDSGIDLEHDANHPSNGWGVNAATGSRPATASASLATPYESKFPSGVGNGSSTSLNTPLIPGLGGDITPKYDPKADGHGPPTPTVDAKDAKHGRDAKNDTNGTRPARAGSLQPATSAHSAAVASTPGYPAPIGPPR